MGSVFPSVSSSEAALLDLLSWSMIVSGAASFLALAVFRIRAPYGKYWSEAGSVYGCMLNGRLAWLLQEAPSFVLPAYFWVSEARSDGAGPMARLSPNSVLLGLFLLHYLHRTFIFPLRIRGGKPTPLLIMLMAFVFCVWNGSVGRIAAVVTHFLPFCLVCGSSQEREDIVYRRRWRAPCARTCAA